ncbi:hypothetical protein DRW03_08310 [Corallococcus sp. H22C18031201]|uniref:M48 family metallopeptidase n=1 Tax=Citreicoccus inhibens TaxID=2849499 RepID=UPI000E762C6E|nr:M48 family metallopeptidase [Citreicoccus inhibens]MBU8894510.1 M48 family metalloprotease [Citreicoccus inhibens]RJS25109.1 hypothetical protein DRW03_08310 [Corallococcus sp. H22C18031201]
MGAVSPPSTARRAMLTVALWAGFWVLALGLAGGLASIPLTQMNYGRGLDLGGILAGVGALVVLWALRPRDWFSDSSKQRSDPLGPEEFPELHALLDEVARKVGTSAPRRVLLSDAATAFIFMERKWLGLRREPVVGIGLPLFALLSRDELAAVLAHEYGHHVGGDLRLGPWVYRTRLAIGSAVESLDDSAFFLDVPFRAYGKLFLRVSASVSRQQELAADALSSATCGSASSARALRKVHAYGPAWRVYLEEDVVPLIEKSVRMPVLEGFRRFLQEGRRRESTEKALEEAEQQEPSPWDSHPPLDARLQALGAKGHSAIKPGPGCLELLGGERPAEDAWFARFTRGELHTMPWEDIAPRVLLPRITQQLAETSLNPRATPPEALPELLAEGGKLWDRLRPTGLDLLSPEAKRQRAKVLLGDWLATALELRGFRPELRPGTHLRFFRENEEVEPLDLVEWVATGQLPVDDYLAWCQSLGPPDPEEEKPVIPTG